eukprot:m.45317 g.45317  ORF g.45317 m.45317 type:complete len:1019 (+) comp7213_c0_seq1:34-3090(+)
MIKNKKFMKKTKKGRVLTVNQEHYLRDDISCGFKECTWSRCNQMNSPLNCESTLFPDTNVILHQMDVLEHSSICNVIICTTVLNEVKHRNLSLYSRLRSLITDNDRRFYVYSNEHSKATAIEMIKGESPNDFNDRAIRTCALWYKDHISKYLPEDTEAQVILITNDADNLAKAKQSGLVGYRVHDYVYQFGNDSSVRDLLAYPSESNNVVMAEGDQLDAPYASHMDLSKLQEGIKGGIFIQGNFNASRENSKEGYVRERGGEGRSILVQNLGMNRAVQGDIVAVQLLPKEEWQTPLNVAERLEATVLLSDGKVDIEDVDEDTSHPVPTGHIVGFIRRKWRPYCGVLVDAKETDEKLLFSPQDSRIPKIRIRSHRAADLINKQLIVAIDAWPEVSKHPTGHVVRVLGDIGDRDVETEVILLEHSVPYETFNDSVMSCLPSESWSIYDEEDSLMKREDFRDIEVCSIDPPGCTDIDDALHLRPLGNGNFEVGVHIADVTHFIRPNTAIDKEAASRGTTVYLSNRRIDMVPGLLSSNLCSLRGGEERFSFSCIWELTPTGEIKKTRFTKSVIKSSAAMTYLEAQTRIDDESDSSTLTESIRQLNKLAKQLKKARIERGALMLASTEVRFQLDNETRDPVDMVIKDPLETNSLVEEFMLLANVSVAEHIYHHFPQCAVLRRHPSPPPANFEPLLKAASIAGVKLSTASSKDLAVSLDNAEPEGKPYLKTLLRMLATRSMMQAVYFSSGTVQRDHFLHYGLAAPIYTHFTSPIRRYADVLVHRLLAASIGADITYPELLDKSKQSSVCDRLNIRNRMAQYASRASTQLHSCFFFKDRPTCAVGYVTRVLKNAVQVLIPHFGVEGPVYFDPIDVENTELHPKLKFDEDRLTLTISVGDEVTTLTVFDEVKVKVSVDEADSQRKRIVLNLVQPHIANISVGEEGCLNIVIGKMASLGKGKKENSVIRDADTAESKSVASTGDKEATPKANKKGKRASNNVNTTDEESAQKKKKKKSKKKKNGNKI